MLFATVHAVVFHEKPAPKERGGPFLRIFDSTPHTQQDRHRWLHQNAISLVQTDGPRCPEEALGEQVKITGVYYSQDGAGQCSQQYCDHDRIEHRTDGKWKTFSPRTHLRSGANPFLSIAFFRLSWASPVCPVEILTSPLPAEALRSDISGLS